MLILGAMPSSLDMILRAQEGYTPQSSQPDKDMGCVSQVSTEWPHEVGLVVMSQPQHDSHTTSFLTTTTCPPS
jgi:hypothetical protein